MKFIRLDITNAKLDRDYFAGQAIGAATSLYVLPDNLPDFRLPRNELETSKNRGGLAEAMRPNKIGEHEDGLPIYDVNIVGVPTISFDKDEPLTTKHITEAFVGIYRLLTQKNFTQLVVPYKGGFPAFGGGVAGAIPADIRGAIQTEFARLEQFLNSPKQDISKLPKEYQAALLEGPLPLKRLPQGKVASILDRAYPRLLLGIKGGFGVILGAMGYFAFSALVTNPLLLAASVLASGALGFAGTTFLAKGLFGQKSLQIKIAKEDQDWQSFTSDTGGLLQYIGLKYPYKSRLIDQEENIREQLSETIKDAEHLKLLTTRYLRDIANNKPSYFYREDLDTVNSPGYVKKLSLK